MYIPSNAQKFEIDCTKWSFWEISVFLSVVNVTSYSTAPLKILGLWVTKPQLICDGCTVADLSKISLQLRLMETESSFEQWLLKPHGRQKSVLMAHRGPQPEEDIIIMQGRPASSWITWIKKSSNNRQPGLRTLRVCVYLCSVWAHQRTTVAVITSWKWCWCWC